MVKLKFKLLSPAAKVPSYARNGDAGFDIFSAESRTLKKGERYAFSTGIESEIPDGYFVSFRGKSGLAIKNGIQVLGGVIDSGYRGEWKVIIINLGEVDYKFETGDKLAQGIVHKLEDVEIVTSDKLSETQRGSDGFGSTGRK